VEATHLTDPEKLCTLQPPLRRWSVPWLGEEIIRRREARATPMRSTPSRRSPVPDAHLRNPLGSKSARVAAGSSGDLAETARQRRFAFELRRDGHAAAARISAVNENR
jgi:hypothetical protein